MERSSLPAVRPLLRIIVLRTVDPAAHAAHLDAHVAWVRRHADAGTFLYCGSFENGKDGGAIIARTPTREALDAILAEDPFLVHGAATHEVLTMKVALGALAGTLA